MFTVVGLVFATLLVFFDLGVIALDSPIVSFRGTSRWYQASLIRRAQCEIFYPDKDYLPIGQNGWSTDSLHGYWCMSDEDIEEFRTTRV